MGATDWSYFVPYEAEWSEALAKLQAKTFDEGEYSGPGGYSGDERHGAKPGTIGALRSRTAEGGTHSILDMVRIVRDPRPPRGPSWEPDFDMDFFAVVAPLPNDDLQRIFGTTKPDHAMIDKHMKSLHDLRGRWEGTCIVVYDGDMPSELLFIGFSGD